MERDSSVKRLDFEDVSLTLPTSIGAAATAHSEGTATFDVSSPPPPGLVELSDNCSMKELRQEAQRIRENFTTVDSFVNSFSGPFQQKAEAEAEAEQTSIKQLKKLFSLLEAESLELAVKEGILKRLAEWKIGDAKNEDDNWLTNENSTDPDNMGDELTALRNANADTISEIESLIKTIASDVNGLETDLTTASGCLDAFDVEAEKLAQEVGTVANLDNNANEHPSVLDKKSENLQDLESTIRHLEATLRQNEKEYMEAEAAMESRIEQYNLEIDELQAQAKELDREEDCMRMLIDVTARFLQSQKHMECSNDVSVASVEDGCIELRLTTYVPIFKEVEDGTEQGSNPMWEHNLHIKINQGTMEIEETKLTPEDVPIDDLLSAAQEKSVATASLEKVKDGELAEFGPQLAFLVRAVHQRLTIHAFKVASLSSVSSDPRYCVEQEPGSTVITVSKPGRLKALIEVPQKWPMHGYSLRLQSIDSLDPEAKGAATLDAMQLAVEVANKMPEYVRHDLLTFIQTIEKIVSD